MAYEITESGDPVFEVDIKRLEKKCNVHLPEDYKEFLIRNNGGRVEPKSFFVGDPRNDRIGQVHYFFIINHPMECCRPDSNYEVFLGRIPRNYFPIATEDGGNIICLSLNAKDYGSVHYWDHNEEGLCQNFENVHKLAPTFTEFLNGLFDNEMD